LPRAVAFLILLIAIAAHGQEKATDSSAKADSSSKDVRLTIVITGGEDKKPIDSASVYVRFVEEHKHGKDKKIEMRVGRLTASITTSTRQSKRSISRSRALPSGIEAGSLPNSIFSQRSDGNLFSPGAYSAWKIASNIFVLSKILKICFILVQTVTSSVFLVSYAHKVRLFHTLFNKTVENFQRAIHAPSL
jgi:hypothetical protein